MIFEPKRREPSPPIDAATSVTAARAATADLMLARLREELDAIDAQLLDTVRRRLLLCCRIGRHKAEHAIAMMQPQRIGVVQARAAAFAAVHGIDPDFLRALYDLVIAETCRLEDQVIRGEREVGP